MKRFLSLFLSVLILFQIENISCDAESHYRSVPNFNLSAAYQVPVQAPQNQPVINVTMPPQNITIHQPEVKHNFAVKVDGTTTADKLWSWLKLTFAIALGYVALNTCWPIIKFFTGFSNPFDTAKNWSKNAIRWMKNVWTEGEEMAVKDSNANMESSLKPGDKSEMGKDSNANIESDLKSADNSEMGHVSTCSSANESYTQEESTGIVYYKVRFLS